MFLYLLSTAGNCSCCPRSVLILLLINSLVVICATQFATAPAPSPLTWTPLDNLTTTELIQPNMFVGSGWDEVKIAFPINIFSVHSSHIAIHYCQLRWLQLTLTWEFLGSSLLNSVPRSIVCILISIGMSFSDFRGAVGLGRGSQARSLPRPATDSASAHQQ